LVNCPKGRRAASHEARARQQDAIGNVHVHSPRRRAALVCGSQRPPHRAAAATTADGWESLGDIGRLDAEGYLYLGDRLADMILRGGANIYPAEVEAAVTEHPDVRSAVVVGLSDPEFGQRVHAILELNGGTDAQAVADNMSAFLADRPSRYKHPESFEAVATSPRDDSGKVRRTMLRDEHATWLKEGRVFRILPSRATIKVD
jgi:bile acid-coenzyme A ligase